MPVLLPESQARAALVPAKLSCEKAACQAATTQPDAVDPTPCRAAPACDMLQCHLQAHVPSCLAGLCRRPAPCQSHPDVLTWGCLQPFGCQ